GPTGSGRPSPVTASVGPPAISVAAAAAAAVGPVAVDGAVVYAAEGRGRRRQGHLRGLHRSRPSGAVQYPSTDRIPGCLAAGLRPAQQESTGRCFEAAAQLSKGVPKIISWDDGRFNVSAARDVAFAFSAVLRPYVRFSASVVEGQSQNNHGVIAACRCRGRFVRFTSVIPSRDSRDTNSSRKAQASFSLQKTDKPTYDKVQLYLSWSWLRRNLPGWRWLNDNNADKSR
ncbi:hypothetical protein THAOC_05426, partial [Thalassiosira oceanica]